MSIITTVYNLDRPHSDFYSQLPTPTTVAARQLKIEDQDRLNEEFRLALTERYLGEGHPDSEIFFTEACLRGAGSLDTVSLEFGNLVKFHSSLKGKIKVPRGVPSNKVSMINTQAQVGAGILGYGLAEDFPQQGKEFI